MEVMCASTVRGLTKSSLAILALVIPAATSPSTSTSLEVSPAGCSGAEEGDESPVVEDGGHGGGLLFRESVLYGLLHRHSSPFLPCRLPGHLIQLGASHREVRLPQRGLSGLVLAAYCFEQCFRRPEKPGSLLGFAFGRGDAREPIQALGGDHLVAELLAEREAFSVGAPGSLVVALQQRRPPQVVHGELETALVSALPIQHCGFLDQCLSPLVVTIHK